MVPNFEFHQADAFKTDLVTDSSFELITCMEFLEHVDGDIDFINRIPQGTQFIGTVPNFPYTSHVRHFESTPQVVERYSKLFNEFEIIELKGNSQGQLYFLFAGVKA